MGILRGKGHRLEERREAGGRSRESGWEAHLSEATQGGSGGTRGDLGEATPGQAESLQVSPPVLELNVFKLPDPPGSPLLSMRAPPTV